MLIQNIRSHRIWTFPPSKHSQAPRFIFWFVLAGRLIHHHSSACELAWTQTTKTETEGNEASLAWVASIYTMANLNGMDHEDKLAGVKRHYLTAMKMEIICSLFRLLPLK